MKQDDQIRLEYAPGLLRGDAKKCSIFGIIALSFSTLQIPWLVAAVILSWSPDGPATFLLGTNNLILENIVLFWPLAIAYCFAVCFLKSGGLHHRHPSGITSLVLLTAETAYLVFMAIHA